MRKGMVRCRGAYLLMADADGATLATDAFRLLDELKRVEVEGVGIAIGSRAHLEDAAGAADAKARRTPLRKLLMWGFHTLIDIMIGSSQIKDTQCGFKLFSRAAARRIFPVQHIDRWAFDVELIYLAAKKRIPMVVCSSCDRIDDPPPSSPLSTCVLQEVPVTWNEIEGSKLDVIASSIQMARDIFAIRVAYMLGFWSYDAEPAVVLESGLIATPATSAPSSTKSPKRGRSPTSSNRKASA